MHILQNLIERINYFQEIFGARTHIRINFHGGEYNYQNNNPGKSVWNKSEAHCSLVKKLKGTKYQTTSTMKLHPTDVEP